MNEVDDFDCKMGVIFFFFLSLKIQKLFARRTNDWKQPFARFYMQWVRHKPALLLVVNNMFVHWPWLTPLCSCVDTREQVWILEGSTSSPVAAPINRLSSVNPNWQLVFVRSFRAIHHVQKRGLSRPASESIAYMLKPLRSEIWKKTYIRQNATSSNSTTVFMLLSTRVAIQAKTIIIFILQ